MRNRTPHLVLNRRDLLLLGGAATAFPSIAFATIPPPPSSPWYLLFIADGIYRISGLYTVTLPASAGNCRSYTKAAVSQAFGANFSFTGRSKLSAWNMLTGAPSFRAWEVFDKRNGRLLYIWELDRIEAKFADGSRVKVVFRGPHAVIRFEALVGTERLPDGTRLYPLDDRRGTLGGDGKGRGLDGAGVTSVTPKVTMFAWHWSSQETPW
jgi:hypothetical protein